MLGYELNDTELESWQGLGIFLFTIASIPALGPTQPPTKWVSGALADHTLCSTKVKSMCGTLLSTGTDLSICSCDKLYREFRLYLMSSIHTVNILLGSFLTVEFSLGCVFKSDMWNKSLQETENVKRSY